MFEARLNDFNGEVVATAETQEEAVEKAFRELCMGWMSQADIDKLPAEGKLFDGQIKGVQVWWYNREDALLGTVTRV